MLASDAFFNHRKVLMDECTCHLKFNQIWTNLKWNVENSVFLFHFFLSKSSKCIFSSKNGILHDTLQFLCLTPTVLLHGHHFYYLCKIPKCEGVCRPSICVCALLYSDKHVFQVFWLCNMFWKLQGELLNISSFFLPIYFDVGKYYWII